MKNQTIVIGAAILLVLVGLGAYSYSQNSTASKDAMMEKEEVMEKETSDSMQKDEGTMEKTDDAMMEKGSYVPYTKAALDGAQGGKRVLFFYASWCPTCRPADADLQANAGKIPAGVTVIRVNYNDPDTDAEEKDLAKKYGVIYQHTFVQIDSQGKEVAKWNGGQLAELLTNLE